MLQGLGRNRRPPVRCENSLRLGEGNDKVCDFGQLLCFVCLALFLGRPTTTQGQPGNKTFLPRGPSASNHDRPRVSCRQYCETSFPRLATRRTCRYKHTRRLPLAKSIPRTSFDSAAPTRSRQEASSSVSERLASYYDNSGFGQGLPSCQVIFRTNIFSSRDQGSQPRYRFPLFRVIATKIKTRGGGVYFLGLSGRRDQVITICDALDSKS